MIDRFFGDVVRSGRTPEKAVEFAGYMATSAEAFLEAVNAVGAVLVAIDESEKDDDGDRTLACALCRAEESQSEAARGLRNAIYEFRKRVP